MLFFWDFRMHTFGTTLCRPFWKEGQKRRKFSKHVASQQIYRLRSRRPRSFSRALHHAVRVSIRLKNMHVVRMRPAFLSRSFASSSLAVVSNSFMRSHIFFRWVSRWVSPLPCSISDDWCCILSFFRIVMTVKSSTYKPASAVTKSVRSSGR